MAEYELSFGGRPFRLPTEKVREQLERLYPLEPGRDFMEPDPTGGGAGSEIVDERPRAIDGPSPELYSFFYPFGATRWAHFRGVMHKDDVEAIVAVSTTPSVQQRQTFVMDDGSGDSRSRIETPLYLLPPRPILGVTDPETGEEVSDLFLITLVDERYYWRWKQISTNTSLWSPPEQENPWHQLITRLSLALNVTIDHEDVDDAYIGPAIDSPLYANFEQAAYILEATASTIGCVVVRKYDGTYELIRHAAARTKAEEARHANRKVAGGQLWSDEPTEPEIALNVPQQVTVLFPYWVDGQHHDPAQPSPASVEDGWFKSNHPIGNTLGTLGAPYSGWKSSPGQAVIRTTMKAEVPSSFPNQPNGTPENLAELTALATILSKDFYDAAAAHLDEVYNGTIAFDPLSACDITVKWGDTMQTRARRAPLNRHLAYAWIGDDAYAALDAELIVIKSHSPDGNNQYDGQLLHEPRIVWWTEKVDRNVKVQDPNGGTYTYNQVVLGKPWKRLSNKKMLFYPAWGETGILNPGVVNLKHQYVGAGVKRFEKAIAVEYRDQYRHTGDAANNLVTTGLVAYGNQDTRSEPYPSYFGNMAWQNGGLILGGLFRPETVGLPGSPMNVGNMVVSGLTISGENTTLNVPFPASIGSWQNGPQGYQTYLGLGFQGGGSGMYLGQGLSLSHGLLLEPPDFSVPGLQVAGEIATQSHFAVPRTEMGYGMLPYPGYEVFPGRGGGPVHTTRGRSTRFYLPQSHVYGIQGQLFEFNGGILTNIFGVPNGTSMPGLKPTSTGSGGTGRDNPGTPGAFLVGDYAGPLDEPGYVEAATIRQVGPFIDTLINPANFGQFPPPEDLFGRGQIVHYGDVAKVLTTEVITRSGAHYDHFPLPKHLLDGDREPTVDDDARSDFSVLSTWGWKSEGRVWICADNTIGAAIWIEIAVGGGGGAPTNAEYIVAAAHGGLSAERVATDHDVVWDFGTAGQAKGRVAGVLQDFALKGVITDSFASSQNDYNPSGLSAATVIRTQATASSLSITGLAGGVANRIIVLQNFDTGFASSVAFTLTHEDAASTTSNRFWLPNSQPMVIGNNESVVLQWDAVAGSGGDGRWRPIASSRSRLSDGDYGDITVSSNGAVFTIDNNTVSDAKLRDSTGLSVIGRSANTTGDPADIAAANDGEVLRRSGTTLGFGTVTTAGLANDAVTFAKMQNIATDRLIGRDTAASGDPEEVSVGNGLEFTGGPGIGIANNGVTYARMQDVSATSRIIGRKSASAGDPEECTLSEVLDFVGSAAHGDILYRGSSTWTRLAAGTSGQFLQTQGSGANPQWATGGGSSWTTEKKSADEGISADTAFSTDAELGGITLAANKNYAIRGKIFFTTTATADFKWTFQVGFVTTLALMNWRHFVPGVAFGTGAEGQGVDTSITTTRTVTGTSTGTGYVQFDITIQVGSTGGDLDFQWAQNTSDAAPNATILRAGSYIEWMQVN